MQFAPIVIGSLSLAFNVFQFVRHERLRKRVSVLDSAPQIAVEVVVEEDGAVAVAFRNDGPKDCNRVEWRIVPTPTSWTPVEALRLRKPLPESEFADSGAFGPLRVADTMTFVGRRSRGSEGEGGVLHLWVRSEPPGSDRSRSVTLRVPPVPSTPTIH